MSDGFEWAPMVPASLIRVFGVWPVLMLRNEGRRLRSAPFTPVGEA